MFILVVVFLNTVVLMLKWTGEPQWVSDLTSTLNYLFTGIFTLECFIKVMAMGPALYFRQAWNRFDFAVILITYLLITIASTTAFDFGPQSTLLRSFKMLKIFERFEFTKNLKVLFNTFIITLPALGSIGGLLALLIYIYSILGVTLFAPVKQFAPLDQVQNFQGFGCTFLILIKIATGDGWIELMNILSRQYSVMNQCIEDPTYQDYRDNGFQSIGCGNFKTAVLYFYSFLLVVKLVFLNIFIAVILEGYETVQMQEQYTINSNLLEHFRKTWALYDPQGTGFLNVGMLVPFLKKLNAPLGLEMTASLQECTDFTGKLGLSMYNEMTQYSYFDIILKLCRQLLIENELQSMMALH